MKIFKKVKFELTTMTVDGFSFCITPSFVFSVVKYSNKDFGFSISLGVFVWLIEVNYNI